jgi:hypothetical protein
MFRVLKTRRFAVAIGVVGALTAAGFAFAYFTSSGSGTGTATVGTDTALAIHGSTSGTLYPGASTPVTFTADNTGGGTEKLGTISLSSVAACSVNWSGDTCNGGSPGVGNVTGCGTVDPGSTSDANASDFYMADVPVNASLGKGSGQSIGQTGTLVMNNLSRSQDQCKSAHLLLNFSAAAPSS